MKKKYGAQAADYDQVDQDGVITTLLPEFVTCSLKPGIGYNFYQQYKTDMYPADYVIMSSKKYPIPRYYDKLMERENPELMEKLKKRRESDSLNRAKDNTPKRLAERETVKQAQVKQLKRPLEK